MAPMQYITLRDIISNWILENFKCFVVKETSIGDYLLIICSCHKIDEYVSVVGFISDNSIVCFYDFDDNYSRINSTDPDMFTRLHNELNQIHVKYGCNNT
jgi:hypothetical protein